MLDLSRISVDDLKRRAPWETAAFLYYYLGKRPFGCQIRWGKRLDDDEIKWEADFEPRDHGKSELFTLAYPLRKLCRDPNIRILVVKNTQRAAMKAVGVVKAQLETNKILRADYAPWWLEVVGVNDICNKTGSWEGQSQWQADKIYVRRTALHQDPTLESVGVGGAITGGHFDIIIIDDGEDPSRLKSDAAFLEQIEWLTGTIFQLREPWTKVIVVGTFKRADGDMYAYVRSNKLFSVNIESAIIYPPLGQIVYEQVFADDGRIVDVKNIGISPDGGETLTGGAGDIQVLCPEKWDIKNLILDRESSTGVMWRREKMNDLAAFKEKVFKAEWFKQTYPFVFLDGWDDPEKPLFKFVLQVWDTAFTEGEESAFSVGATWGVRDDGYYLLPFFYRDHPAFPDLKEAVARLYLRCRPNMVAVEYKASGISVVQELRQPFLMRDGTEVRVPIARYEVDRDKVARAEAVTPAFEAGHVYLPQPGPGAFWINDWIEEHINFPDSMFKDQVDTTSMALDILRRRFPLVRKPPQALLRKEEQTKLRSRAAELYERIGVTGISPRRTARFAGIPGRTSRNFSDEDE